MGNNKKPNFLPHTNTIYLPIEDLVPLDPFLDIDPETLAVVSSDTSDSESTTNENEHVTTNPPTNHPQSPSALQLNHEEVITICQQILAEFLDSFAKV